jgi:hypothetical protein
MKKTRLASFSLFLFALAGCASAADDSTQGEAMSALGTEPTIPELPHPGGTGSLAPWGGADPSRWRPEAIVANAASAALNEGWSQSNVKDVVVAVPVKMLPSDFFEFGDGQANAAPSFEWWRDQSRPPLVATLIRAKQGDTKVRLKFDRALPYGGTAFELRYRTKTVPLTATRNGDGDAIIEWTVPSDLAWNDLLNAQSAIVHPVGWADWFPLQFRMPVKRARDLRAASLRFSDGRGILDREGVTSVGNSDGKTALDRLLSHSFAGSYNGRTGSVGPFTPSSIHATFPRDRQQFTTGVGRGWTWVADERPSGFKVMYTCFERRRADLEASAPNGGVASGGGWHQINDPAETIVNNLENGPLVVASAQGNPWLESHLPSGVFAYDLTDVITVRWLRPGEAFITTHGQWTTDGRGKWFDQSNYHWYFFHGDKDVCTEELINPPGLAANDFDI